MKELVISLLQPSEKQRVLTKSLIGETLKTLIDEKIISLIGRAKYEYTEDELHVVTSICFKLEDCDDKFMGAFLTWFAYGPNAPFHANEECIYKNTSKYFDVCLSYIRELCCMLHRIKSLRESNQQDCFKGKVYLMIIDNDNQIEPLSKHAKYFNEFSELNLYDF